MLPLTRMKIGISVFLLSFCFIAQAQASEHEEQERACTCKEIAEAGALAEHGVFRDQAPTVSLFDRKVGCISFGDAGASRFVPVNVEVAVAKVPSCGETLELIEHRALSRVMPLSHIQ